MHANYNSSSSEDEIPFPDTLLIPDVNPSYDLVNEPFSWDDDGVRPDIRSQGSKYFECETLSDGHAVCRAGRVTIGGIGEAPIDVASYLNVRVSTNTSLIDIYTYAVCMTARTSTGLISTSLDHSLSSIRSTHNL